MSFFCVVLTIHSDHSEEALRLIIRHPQVNQVVKILGSAVGQQNITVIVFIHYKTARGLDSWVQWATTLPGFKALFGGTAEVLKGNFIGVSEDSIEEASVSIDEQQEQPVWPAPTDEEFWAFEPRAVYWYIHKGVPTRFANILILRRVTPRKLMEMTRDELLGLPNLGERGADLLLHFQQQLRVDE